MWATRTVRLNTDTVPVRALAHHIHDLMMTLTQHPIPQRRVQRPSTPETWVRLLASGYSELMGAPRARTITSLLKGYRAMAPGPNPTSTAPRGLAMQWQAAMDAVLDDFHKQPTPCLAATWLALELTRQGMRPKPAIRGAMSHSQRTQRTLRLSQDTAPADVYEVKIHIDKDNPLGRVSAWRRRWIPVVPAVTRIMRKLPYDNYDEIFDTRRRYLTAQGVPQVYAGRRDAAAYAEELAMPVDQLLNHRPGSASTPGYTMSVTATSLLRAMLQATVAPS
jgi:hypothetical protein